MSELELREVFIKRYEELLGEEFEDFMRMLSIPLTHSIRLNTLKLDGRSLLSSLRQKGWRLRRIPWYRDGFWILRPEHELGNTIEHQLGYFYVQEAASMLPPLALDPRPNEVVLDLCAAPGSKTTQMAQLMENTGAIVANDVDMERIKALGANIQRLGVANTLVTRADGRLFPSKIEQRFDRVLVDAPCSASGTLRKNPFIARELSLGSIRKLSKLQKSLILAGFDCLKPGGVLVYSTCSLEPEENEEVLDFLLRKRDARLESIGLNGLRSSKGITKWRGREFEPEVMRCVRVYPQANDTDGFFLARVKKGDSQAEKG
jgi:NOL1/NOP2/sun family putative RNA methylase